MTVSEPDHGTANREPYRSFGNCLLNVYREHLDELPTRQRIELATLDRHRRLTGHLANEAQPTAGGDPRPDDASPRPGEESS